MAAPAGAAGGGAPDSPGAGRLAVGLVALGIGLFTWPALPTLATALLGHPFAEVDNHLWMAWFGGRADAPARDLPVGFDLPLMDPVNLLWWAPGALLGPVFAYNVAILGNLALAALGGWALARELTGSRAAALVGMVATAFSPFLGGAVEFGLSEAWPVGWLALHAALLLRYARTGALRDVVGASAALGALLLSGWYHAAFALPAEVGLGLWVLARRPRQMRLATVGVLFAQGLVATLPVLPRLAETRAHAAIWAPRLSGLTRPQVYEDWDGNPRFGTDLLNLVLPRLDAIPTARTVYVGVVVLALAAIALRRRSGWALWALAVPLWVLALGHWLRVGGVPVAGLGPLPAGWLVGTFDAARGLSHWFRAAGPATVFVGAAAAVGTSVLLDGLRARFGWAASRRAPVVIAALLAGLVLTDAIALAPTPWPRVTYPPDPPAALLDLPRAGALVQLPFDEGRGLDGIASRRVYDQWQVFHGRSIAEHYEGRDALLHANATVADWQRACARVAPRLPARPLAEDLRSLRDLGVAYVVAHPPFARSGCVDAIARDLGAPMVITDRAVIWDLAAGVTPGVVVGG